jgi:beta-glucanase (GH16 family)
MWPAFWLLSTNSRNESDIAEIYGNHKWPDGVTVHSVGGDDATARISPPGTGWNTWSEVWNSSKIKFYEDGRLLFSTDTPADFTGQKMYLILNLAVGGSGGGAIPSSTSTMTMLVKWISVKK